MRRGEPSFDATIVNVCLGCHVDSGQVRLGKKTGQKEKEENYMRGSIIVWSLLATFVLASSGWASTILPTDDVTYRGSSRYNNTSVYGLFTKGDGNSDRAYLQFSADTTSATSATLNLYNYWGTPQGKTVNFDIRVRGIGENEAGYVSWTELATPAPSGTSHESWAIQGDWHVDSTPAWYAVDVTALYNANLGNKLTFSVRALSGTGDGPIFEDKEGRGGTANAPYIEWVPEPASLALLALGSLLVVRRRR